MSDKQRIKELEAQIAALMERVAALEARPAPSVITITPSTWPINPWPNQPVYNTSEALSGR